MVINDTATATRQVSRMSNFMALTHGFNKTNNWEVKEMVLSFKALQIFIFFWLVIYKLSADLEVPFGSSNKLL